MSEKLSIQVYLQSLTALELQNAVKLVELCNGVDGDELEALLPVYMDFLERVAKNADAVQLETFLNTVYKGFRFKSELADALRYFYLGYYSRFQEEVLAGAKNYAVQLRISQIAAKKHFKPIMRYLYQNGISQQKDIVAALGINKSNLSRVLEDVVASRLVNKMRGRKLVFYQLSKKGYEYCRQHRIDTKLDPIETYEIDSYAVKSFYTKEEPRAFCYEIDIPIPFKETENEAKTAKIKKKDFSDLFAYSDDYGMERIAYDWAKVQCSMKG